MQHKANILVVDDQRSMRLTLGAILEDKGYGVDLAEDGYRAIEAVRKNPYDVIFMDIRMPGIDGVQAFREIKKIDPQVTVIMMTAYSVEELIKKALQEGAYAVLYKPFDMEKITDIITKAITNLPPKPRASGWRCVRGLWSGMGERFGLRVKLIREPDLALPCL